MIEIEPGYIIVNDTREEVRMEGQPQVPPALQHKIDFVHFTSVPGGFASATKGGLLLNDIDCETYTASDGCVYDTFIISLGHVWYPDAHRACMRLRLEEKLRFRENHRKGMARLKSICFLCFCLLVLVFLLRSQ